MKSSALSILMLCPAYYPHLGGLERQAHTLSRALVRLGCRVTVLTRHLDPALPRHDQLDGVQIWRLPSAARAGSKDWRFPLSLMAAVLRLGDQYDVVHSHGMTWFLLGAVMARQFRRLPLLVKIPNVRDCGIPGLQRRRSGVWLLRLMQQADAWAVLSTESRHELIAAGFPAERIFFTHNGVDTEQFFPCPAARKHQLRLELGLPVQRPLIVFAGRLLAQKGVADLLAAWPQVQQATATQPYLIICGDGPQRGELAERVRAAGLTDLGFAGAVAQISDYYQAADLFVLPSYAEGNSNAMMEAMACGLPVVATDVGGSADLLGPQAAPWLLQPGDVAGLAHRLIKLLNDAALRQSIGMSLMQRMADHFSIESTARRYLECYRLLIAGQARQISRLPVTP